MRYLILLLFTISLISCGPLNTVNTNNNDGIYGNKVEVSNNNSAFYKNYFEQKSNELGINSAINDSVLTDINSYSSNTNVSYSNSNGSWGDNPTSVNIIFRNRYVYKPYMNYYPYGYNWHDNFMYNYRYWGRWYSSPWGFNYPRFGYGYGYGYGMWNNWWHPYYNGPDYNDPYYYRNDSRVAYMNGKRSSLYSSYRGILDNSSSLNSTTIYNVGRNDNKIVNSRTGEKSEKLEQIKNRNINRVYYALKNSQGRVGPARGYQNRGEMGNYGNSSTDNKSKSNFQASKYGNTRSYDVNRSSTGSLNKGRVYSRPENNGNNTRSYSRPENSSNNSSNKARNYSRTNISSSSSNSTRPNYSSSSNSSRSSVGRISSGGSSGRSGSVSRGKR